MKHLSVVRDLVIIFGIIAISFQMVKLNKVSNEVNQLKAKITCNKSAYLNNLTGENINYEYCTKWLGQAYLDKLNAAEPTD